MLESGTLLQSRYRILSQIGKGGMGTVYIARDENIGMTVAVKRNFLEEPRLIEAFKREARLLAGLRHPALPQVKDYFIDATGQYIVMEYIAGDDLGTVLQKRQQNIAPAGEAKPFDVEDVTRWAEQLLDALDYLHTRSEPIVHRDIKPVNLKLAERGQIILLDFGLAKGKPLWMTRATSTGSLYGYTPNYAPIEQIRGLGTDPRSDLYALGATLYHLITGESPIDAATRAESFLGAEPDPLLPANKLNPKVPKGLSSLLVKAMEPHRNNRPSSAGEMLNMLRMARHSTVIDWQAWQQEEKQAQQEQPAESVPQAEYRGDARPTIQLAPHEYLEQPNDEEQASKAKEEIERLRRREEAERIAREESELQAKQEAERRAREEAELKAKQEAERKAREQAELQAKQEAERKAREEAERKAREEAQRRRRQQYDEERLKREAEILALQKELEEEDRKAREEAELKTKQEAERKAREEAELKAKQEAELKARAEAEHKAKQEAERKSKEEAERKAKEKAEREAREVTDRRRRQYEEARLKRVAEILRLQKEQEEADRKEAEGPRLQPVQELKAAEEGGVRRPQQKPRKDEAIDKPARQPVEGPRTAVEQAQLWLQKLKPQTRARPETDPGNHEEEIRTRLNKERARRLYASIGVAALVLLVLSISIMVLTSNKLKKADPQGTDDQTAQPALDPGLFETPSRVLKVALSDDGSVLASAGEETTVRLWRLIGSRELPGQAKKCRTVAVSRDGRVVASGTEDGAIRLWRASDGVVLKSWRGHTSYVISLDFSPDGQILFSGGGDRYVRLWRVSDGQLLVNVKTSINDLIVAVSANRRLVGLNRQDGRVHLFYMSGDILVPASDIKATPVNCGEFSNDGDVVALGGTQGDVGLWRVSDGQLIKALGKFNLKTMSLTFSRDGQILAAGLADGAIKLWRVSDGKLIKTLVGHAKSVNSLSFSADGRTLASGSDDKTVRVWNVEDNQQ